MDNLLYSVLLINTACALFMSGVIWVIQLVHYPLMDMADKETYPTFQQRHMKRISFVVMPPMIVELASTIFLLVRASEDISSLVWGSAGLLLIVWLSTFLLQVPQHDKLTKEFDPTCHQRLVMTNWIRTLAWSLRSIVLLIILAAVHAS